MKILAFLLILAPSCLAIPTSHGHILPKREIASGSDHGSNLVEATTRNADSLTTGNDLAASNTTTPPTTPLPSTTFKPQTKEKSAVLETEKSSNVTENPPASNNVTNSTAIESRLLPDQEPQHSTPFHADEFKVRVLDLTSPTKPKEVKNSQVSIGLPSHHQGNNVLKVPEIYVVRVPHFVVVKESAFFSHPQYTAPTISGPFHPFQHIPELNQDFSSSSDLFGISSVYPIHPIVSPPQGIGGQYPIIGGGSEIPVLTDFGEISQGFEILQPGSIGTVGFTDEKFNYETDSVIVDALRRTSRDLKEFQISLKKTKEASSEQEQKLNNNHIFTRA